MTRRFVTYCLLFFCLLISAKAQQPVTITGTAPFAKNEEIRLLVFEDLLNHIPKVVATDKIDRNGKFVLSYPTNQILLAQLAIRTSRAEFFIVPNNQYDFQISTDSVLFQRINPERYGGYLEITSNKKDTNDLNFKINRFSNYFSRAMSYYAFRITFDKDASAYDTLTSLLNEKFDVQYNPLNFYQSYVYYTCGTLDKLCFPKDNLRIYQTYFDNDYILYNNPAYMSLFAEHYSGYLYNSKYISKKLLSETINENPDYLKLFNEVGRDPMLVNERIRELVLIYNLIEFCDNEEFDRGNVIKLLRYIKASSHFAEHQPLIDNALQKLVPDRDVDKKLLFKNSKGRREPFKHFGGKDIYVQFFQSDCMDCIREMMLIKELNSKYGSDIQFISMNVDPDERQYEDFHKTYGEMFDWPILYFNQNYDWLLENGIETLPDYMIINENGQILQRYAPAPDKGLSDYLQSRFAKEEPENDNPLFRNKQ